MQVRVLHTFLCVLPYVDPRVFHLALRTSITQEFTLDGEPLALIFYDLERKAGSSALGAQLIAFSTYRTVGTSPVASSPTTHYPIPHGLLPTQLNRFRPIDHQTSLSCGLPPMSGSMPLVMTTSVLF
jgi:hypothetical protein